MRRRTFAVATAAMSSTLALLLAVPASGSGQPRAGVAPAPAVVAGRAVQTTVASWQMNEGPGARVMRDSGPRHLDGTVGTLVRTGKQVRGATAYRFPYTRPNTPPARPEQLVKVYSGALNPGSSRYAITFRYRTTHKFGNIIQKGQAKTPGGQVKIELPGGHVTCLFRGSAKRRAVTSKITVNDGRWHTVRCERDANQVVLTIDNSYIRRIKGRTGRIANTWPMTIGGKPKCNQVKVSCDYFAGDIDWVTVQSG